MQWFFASTVFDELHDTIVVSGVELIVYYSIKKDGYLREVLKILYF